MTVIWIRMETGTERNRYGSAGNDSFADNRSAIEAGRRRGDRLAVLSGNTTDDLTAKWTSSDESIASSQGWKATAHKAGVVKIALKVSDVSRSVEMLVLPEDASSISVEIKYPTSDADYLKYVEAAEVSVHMQPGNYDITNLIRMSVDDENILMLNPPVRHCGQRI